MTTYDLPPPLLTFRKENINTDKNGLQLGHGHGHYHRNESTFAFVQLQFENGAAIGAHHTN